jgi:uncharacterized repeat protein (TIGR03803 family)
MKKNLLSFIFGLCFIAFASGQSQEKLWGIMNGIPVHLDLNGDNLTRINGDTTGTGRQTSLVQLGNDGYLYGTSTYNQTDTRLIYKMHQDSMVLHVVIKLKYGARILGLAIDDNNVIFGSALDELTGIHFVFSVDNNGHNYRILHRFPVGNWIHGVVVDEDYIYGVQGIGAGDGTVTVFKISKADASHHTLVTVEGSPATPLLLTRNDELVWITSARYDFNAKQINKIKTNGADFWVLNSFFTQSPDISSLIETRDGKIFGAYTAAGFPLTQYIFRLETDQYGFAEQIQIHDNSWTPSGNFMELPDGRLISESANSSGILFFSPDDGTQNYVPSGNLRNLRDVGADGKVYGITGDGFSYGPPTSLYAANLDGSDFKILHTFGVNDAGSFTRSLIEGPDGNIYGINAVGGANTNGTVFKISPEGISKIFDNGDLTVGPLYANTDGYLYTHNTSLPVCHHLTFFRFKTNGEGEEIACVRQRPFSSSTAIQLSTGEMVGVSRAGVESGFMYRFKPDLGGIEVLRSFTKESGRAPLNIIEGSNGYLYGINHSGGAYNLGGVFRVKPDGSDYKLLVQFNGNNGWPTMTNLVQDSNGTLYGVMPTRFASKKGFIFSLRPDGSDYKPAFDFTSTEIAGISPGERILMDDSGRLYNSGILHGEAIVYAINPDGQQFQKIVAGAVELSFITRSLTSALVQVIQPKHRAADLPIKITFHLTPVKYAETYTLQLSKRSDFMTIEQTKTHTTNSIEIAGLEYGTTYFARVKTNLWPTFGPVTKFRTKTAALRLWGVTSTGGTSSNGTIFSIDINGTSFVKHHDYSEPNNVANLHDKLIPLDDGETLLGYSVPPREVSTNSVGEIFTIKADGRGFEVISIDGFNYGGLMKSSNRSFYYTDLRANRRLGAIFSFDLDFKERTRVHAFKHDDGTNPASPLLEHNGYLYGMTPRKGYKNNNGTIYRIKISDHVFEKIHDFDKPIGKNPEGCLIDGANGFLYGMTTSGGLANDGSIFRVKPDGSEFKKLHDFSNANGRKPLGDLLLYGGRLYGMTSIGGKHKRGVIFRINRSGTGYVILHHFSGSDGARPLKNLMVYKGSFYGMTSKGGSSNLGVIFRIKSNGTEFKKLFDFNYNTGGAPDGSLLLVPTTFSTETNSARSAVAAVVVENAEQQVSVEAYPNPFLDVLYVNITNSSETEFQSVIMDMSGRIVGAHTGATNTTAAIRTNFGQGLYVLRVTVGSLTKHIRVVRK